MTQDRVVIREDVEPVKATKDSPFSIFKSKNDLKPLGTPSMSGGASSLSASIRSTPSSTPVPADDQELPERIEHPSSSPSSNDLRTTPFLSPTPPNQTDDIDAKIPAKAGFDFHAIGKVLGKGDDFNPERIPAGIVSPKAQTAGVPNATATGRSESAPPPLTQERSPAVTPKAKTRQLEVADEEVSGLGPLPSLATLRQNSRSLSFEVGSLRNDPTSQEVSTNHISSLTTHESLSLTNHTSPSWPPSSSHLSLASADTSVWAPDRIKSPSLPHSTNHTSSLSSSSAESEPSISFDDQGGLVHSAPQLSFGSVDGSVSSYDPKAKIERDPWAPRPLGLPAAIASKTSYAINPWET